MNQVNSTLSKLRLQAQGVPGAMQYVNQVEKLWKQAQAQWALLQQYQQQDSTDKMRSQLLSQQQNLMNQLNKQQQFLQQQLNSLKSPELKTIDPFGDYVFQGVSLHPTDGRLHGPGTIADTPELSGLFRQQNMNAKGGAGMETWKEAIRQLDSISSASSSFSTPPAAQSKKPKDKGGSYDNPLADDSTVRILGSGARSLTDGEREAFLEETKGNKYAEMSSSELKTLSEQYLNNAEIQKAINALIANQKTYKNLSEFNENAYINEYWSNREMGEGNKAVGLAAAQTVDLLTNIPAVLAVKVASRDKGGAINETVQFGGSEYLEKSMEDIPDLARYSKIVPFVSKTMLVNDLSVSIPEAYKHYDSGIESWGYTQATGGYRPALTKAEKARQDMLFRSQKLYDLIEEQNSRKSAPSSEPKPKADSATTPLSKIPGDSNWRELHMDPNWIIKGGSGPSE